MGGRGGPASGPRFRVLSKICLIHYDFPFFVVIESLFLFIGLVFLSGSRSLPIGPAIAALLYNLAAFLIIQLGTLTPTVVVNSAYEISGSRRQLSVLLHADVLTSSLKFNIGSGASEILLAEAPRFKSALPKDFHQDPIATARHSLESYLNHEILSRTREEASRFIEDYSADLERYMKDHANPTWGELKFLISRLDRIQGPLLEEVTHWSPSSALDWIERHPTILRVVIAALTLAVAIIILLIIRSPYVPGT